MPELIWALVLVTVVGLGPAAGTVAVALHGVGLLAKLWSEQLDGVDPRPVEAVRLTGASHAATLALAVVPQARPGLLSLLLYQLECNVRTATVSASSAPVASGRRSTWRCGCSTTASSGPS